MPEETVRHYLVMDLQETILVGNEENEEILTWAEGMIGAMPVFQDYESALKYAEDDADAILSLVRDI